MGLCRLPEAARILKEIRSFFDFRDYIEIHPVIIPHPGLEPQIDAFSVDRRRQHISKPVLNTR